MSQSHHRLVVLFLFLGFLGGIATLGAIPDTQRQALIALYNSTNGDGWTYKAGWKDGTLHTDGFALPGTEGTWYGVTVDADNVTWISLGGNGLSGTIPAALGGLPPSKCSIWAATSSTARSPPSWAT